MDLTASQPFYAKHSHMIGLIIQMLILEKNEYILYLTDLKDCS